MLCVVRIVKTLLAVTLVAVIVDILSTMMDAHVMVYSLTVRLVVNLKMFHYHADRNECSSASTNACQQVCVNNPGSYTCQCRAGYNLNADGRTCTG